MARMTGELRIGRARLALYQGLVAAAFFVLWWALTETKILAPFFFGEPLKVLRVIWEWFTGGKIYPHLAITLWETVLAFLAGSALGLLVGREPFHHPVVLLHEGGVLGELGQPGMGRLPQQLDRVVADPAPGGWIDGAEQVPRFPVPAPGQIGGEGSQPFQARREDQGRGAADRKSTRLNSSHPVLSRMPSSA